MLGAVAGESLTGLGDYGEGASGSRESRGFGETSKFDGNLASPLNFINRFRQRIIPDKGLIGRIIQDQGFGFARKINPGIQLGFGNGCTGRIVGKTKIYQVNAFLGQVRNKTIFPGAFQLDHIFVSLVFKAAGSACHNVTIQVHGVNRIRQGNPSLVSKYFLNIARIALGTVTDKNFIR